MINRITKLLDFIRYGKLVTEDYTGKVVKVEWTENLWDGESRYRWESGTVLINVLWDDGSRFIAGPLVNSKDWVPGDFISSKDGLHHTCKGHVTVIADSLADYEEAVRIRLTRARWQQNVCSNEAGVVGIVTGYDGVVFCGKSLEGRPWRAAAPKLLAGNYQEYSQGIAVKI